MFDYNFLGMVFVSDDVDEEKAKQVNEKMEQIIEKYSELAQEEFLKYLDGEGLESAMGVVLPKGRIEE